MPVNMLAPQVLKFFFLLMIGQHNTFSLWIGYQINPKITQNLSYILIVLSHKILVFPSLTMEQKIKL